MQGVRQQRGRAATKDHHKLQQRSSAEPDERELDRPNPLAAARQSIVQTVSSIMAVWREERSQKAQRPARMRMLVPMVVIVVMAVIMVVVAVLLGVAMLMSVPMIVRMVAVQRLRHG